VVLFIFHSFGLEWILFERVVNWQLAGFKSRDLKVLYMRLLGCVLVMHLMKWF